MRSEIESFRRMFERFKKEVLMELEARTSLVTTKLKDDVFVHLETVKIEKRREVEQHESLLKTRIEDFESIKNKYSDCINTIEDALADIREDSQVHISTVVDVLSQFKEKIEDHYRRSRDLDMKIDTNHNIILDRNQRDKDDREYDFNKFK
ncbi:hypothetical protein AKO1_002124, partial [Acrasis kona]